MREKGIYVVELEASSVSPISAFLRLRKIGANILLESLEHGKKWSRFSLIGFGKRGPCFENAEEKAWQELRDYLKDRKRPSLSEPFLFQGGLVGHLSYDLVTHLGPVPLPEKKLMDVPQMAFLEVENFLVFDSLKRRILVFSKNKSFAKEIINTMSLPLYDTLSCTSSTRKPVSTFTKERFIEASKALKEEILSGEAIQVVLAQIFTVQSSRDPMSVYRHLRRINPSPYMFYIEFGHYTIIGSSPEMMVRLRGKLIQTRPIAGTRPRTGNPERDRRLVEELMSDKKEEAEHVMLVDLARNDIGKVSEIGSVRVSQFKAIEGYSHVFHIVSQVEGQLKKGFDALDVLRATFPAGTLSGAPKVRAMQLISQMEPVRRGIYGGALGYISWNGNMDTAITIRSAVYKDGLYYIGAGAGIVADSNPQREYHECLYKAQAIFNALGVKANESPDNR